MSNQTLLAQGWACGRWTRFCCSWQTRNLGMQKSSFICSTCETKKPMDTQETQAPAPELLVNLRRSNKQLLTKRMGRTPMFLCFYVWISYDMFLLHFSMLHVHQHTCTVVWEPYDVARITHTHTPVCRTFWFAVRNISGCRKRQREMGLRMSMWARVHAVLMIGAPGRLKVKRLPRM